MKARILNLFLAAAAGTICALIASCTTSDVAGTNAAVSGAGAACTVNSDCLQGLECEHSVCQPHRKGGEQQQGEGDAGEADEGEDHDDHDAGTAQQCSVSTDCPSGQECDDGACKADDSGSEGGDDSGGSEGPDGY